MIELKYPFDENQIRALKAGDAVSITGPVHTGRDKFHKWFADGNPIAVDFRDGALYHCGPVIVKDGEGWAVLVSMILAAITGHFTSFIHLSYTS